MQPTVEHRRAQLIAARDQFLAKGYEAEINIEALKVQTPTDGDAQAQQIAALENTRANCDAAARRMDELLKKLPKPKDEKK